MAEPNFTVETPDWMKQGRDVADEWLRMQAGNQNQQRLNLQQQEQNALLPLKVKAYQQDQQMQGLKIGEAIRNRDELLQSEQAAQGLGDKIAPYLQQEKPLDALNALLTEGVKQPILMKSPQWQTLMKEVQGAVTADTARQQLKSVDAYRQAQQQELKMRAAKEEAQAYDIGLGEQGTKTTAFARNSKLLEDAQGAYDSAVSAFNEAQTPEEQAAANQVVTSAQNHLKSVQAFVPRANEAVRMKHMETMAAYGAQKQRILGELKSLDSAIMKKADKDAKREALKSELIGLEDKYFPKTEEAPSQFDHQPAPPSAVTPAATPFGPRPPGLTDDEIKKEAADAITQKKRDPDWIRQALEAWGVK